MSHDYWVYRDAGSDTYGISEMPRMFWIHPSNRSWKSLFLVWLYDKGWF